ncbi:MAG: NAD(P)H-binding protein [Nitrospiraceae bacterium]
MRVLVTGAHGFLGTHLVQALHGVGHDVLCCGRNAEALRKKFPSCSILSADFSSATPYDWDAALRGVSVVINAVGIIQESGSQTFEAVHHRAPTALFQAAERVGVRRIIHISALGADADAVTPYHRTKQAGDDALRALKLDWVILQPSLVYGAGGRSHTFFSALAALPVLVVPGRGDQPIQPVHVEDLTAGIVRLVDLQAPSRMTIPVVGPEPVTYRHFLAGIRAWLGLRPSTTLSMPMVCMRVVSRVGDVCKSPFVNSGTLSMLCRGNVADPSAFSTATGIRPRTLAEGLPPHGADYGTFAAACLYFLLPALRGSLVAVWIGSGLVSLFAFPIETSEGWLRQVGIPEALTRPTLVVASALDITLGLALGVRWRVGLVLAVQFALTLGFTVVLTLSMPEWWAHPFGPLLKNLPLLAATWLLWALERRT